MYSEGLGRAGLGFLLLGFVESFFDFSDVGGIEARAHFPQRSSSFARFQRTAIEIDADDTHCKTIRGSSVSVERSG